VAKKLADYFLKNEDESSNKVCEWLIKKYQSEEINR